MDFSNIRNAVLLVGANLLIILTLVAVLNPTWEIGSDGFSYYSYLRSPVFDQDFNFTNEYQEFDRFHDAHNTERVTPLGKTANQFSVGPAMLWSPFVLTAHLSIDSPEPDDQYNLRGYGNAYQNAVFIGTLFYYLLGLLFLYLTARFFWGPLVSALATTGISLISPLIYYVLYEPSMSHVLSFFAVSGLIYFLVKNRERGSPVNYAGMGFWVGLAALIRWQNAIFGLIPLIWLFFSENGKLKQKLIKAASYIGTAFVTFLPQLLMWKHLYGSYIAVPQGEEFFDLLSPHTIEFLFSGYHGLFVWHPLVLIGIVGLVWLWRQNKLLTIALFIPLLLQIYLNSALSDWMGGGSFGARRMVGSLPIIGLGLGATLKYSYDKFKQIGFWLLILLLIAGSIWNLALMISVARDFVPMNAPVTVAEILNQQIYTLSQMLAKVIELFSFT